MSTVFQAEYAGHPIRYAFLDASTRKHFRRWLRPVEGEAYDIKATPELIAETLRHMPEENPAYYAEYKALIGLTSKKLLQYQCCIFHAVAFLLHDRAWLLTAPSGTGKTTQFLNWRRLFPGEITMICGDMPILEQREDGSVWAHSSPWNGKEGVGNRIGAPLGGVILLEQGRDNTISSLPPREAIFPLLKQFASNPETESEIRALFGLLNSLLCFCPVWKYQNKGDDASTVILRETILHSTGE